MAKSHRSSPAKGTKAGLSEVLRDEVQRKANELVETTLKPRYVKPPPTDSQFNYVIGLFTEWYRGYLYFVATYACPSSRGDDTTFESKFARLEFTANGQYNLSYMRHNDQWFELFRGLTLDECLASIRDEMWFQID